MTKRWTFAVAVTALLSVSQGAWAFSVPQPDAEKVATKVAFIELNAQSGDAEAEYLLGLMYLSGRYVDQQAEVGLEWLQRAASNQHVKAIQTLADLYYDGKVVPRDLEQSVHWYQELAQTGQPYAYFRLGLIFGAGGDGIQRNCGQAVEHFNSAGDQVSLGNVAWILATCPEGEYRDGTRAVELSLELLKHDEQDPSILDNLAAAYAETGDFAAAVSTQQKAIDALRQRPEVADISEFQQRLQIYLQKRAYREVIPLL
ncbi:sel1 repeat family protein [Shewanella corallii]|uniref:Sel1 repeat family protein n=1 Tax=Shewanella corallii TaxID=560080 RepID=A0ABT0NBZ6_9GAMM|nr:tetratricopeptide repeat protein [Shewanella corallii]MCL2915963.1 sel1 repeat family protein [Shewanella corallii]